MMTDILDDLEAKAEAATPGPWYPPHFGDETMKCQCRGITEEGWAGGIASIHVGNGIPISEGGNDCPPPSEAAANGNFIAAANPTAIKSIISRCRKAEAEVERLRRLLAEAQEGFQTIYGDGVIEHALWHDQPDTKTVKITCQLGVYRKVAETARKIEETLR